MSTQVRHSLLATLGQLRHEPIAKRIRAESGGTAVVDTTRAILVWEPRRVVPSCAVPVEDVRGELTAASAAGREDATDVGHPMPEVSTRPVLDPSIPFVVHSTDGQPMDLTADGRTHRGVGFGAADADLTGYVILDFAAFDTWYEEDEVTVAHPRDPFHRIDILPSSRQLRLELDGVVLAESTRPVLLFETLLPTRYYLSPEEVRADLVPSPTRSYCAYKGQASYWSAVLPGQTVADLAWTYDAPQREAEPVRGLISFFDERIDVVLDGTAVARPVTPWSRPAGRSGAGPDT